MPTSSFDQSSLKQNLESSHPDVSPDFLVHREIRNPQQNSSTAGALTERKRFSLFLLALCGFLISLYLLKAQHQVTTQSDFQPLACDVNALFDCSAVMASAWSHLFGRVPLSALATGLFGGLLLIYTFAQGRRATSTVLSAGILTSVACVVGSFYFGVMLLVLKKLCFLCLLIDVILVTMTLLQWKQLRLGLPKPLMSTTFRQRVPALLMGLVSLTTICLSLGSALLFAVTGGIFSSPLPVIVRPDASGQRLIEQTIHGKSDERSPGTGKQQVIVYVFTDFECGACRAAYHTLTKLQQIYGERVRIVSIHTPLNSECNPTVGKDLHPSACEAARVALSARSEREEASLKSRLYAGDLPVVLHELGQEPNLTQRLRGRQRLQIEALLRRDVRLGERLHVRSLPTAYIAGRRLEGAYPLPDWINIVEAALHSERVNSSVSTDHKNSAVG